MGYKNGSSAKKKCFFLLEVARLLIKTFIMNSTLASNLTLQNRTEKKNEKKKAFVERTHCTVDLQTTKMWLFIDFFFFFPFIQGPKYSSIVSTFRCFRPNECY